MEKDKKALYTRLTDYRRFGFALTILSIYLYLGSLIKIYLDPSEKGALLLVIATGCVTASGVISVIVRKWHKQIAEQ